MKYAIITPTYVKHFCFIEPYLQSFQKYVEDGDKVQIYFIISREEKQEFDEITKLYRTIDFQILVFEDLLQHFGVTVSPENLLLKYGRFTFQTLKKFYALLFIPEERSLVLDCESMWVKKTRMSEVFENFYASPRLYGSLLANRPRTTLFVWQIVENADFILGKKCPYWFLETFMWFYEKKILQDLTKECGDPIQLAEKLFQSHKKLRNRADLYHGIFDATIYQNYIYFNQDKYHYELIDMDAQAQKYLPQSTLIRYHEAHSKLWQGNCGVFEHVCLILTKSNVCGLGRMFKNLNVSIMRCNSTSVGSYRLQKRFMKIIQPSILAASQNHVFGIKNKFSLLEEQIKKFNKHLRRFTGPIASVMKWVGELFSVIFYAIKIFVKFLRLILLG